MPQISKQPFYIDIPYSKNKDLGYTILCRPLSHKEIMSLQSGDSVKENVTNFKLCKIGITYIETHTGDKIQLSELPYKHIKNISKQILAKSIIEEKTIKGLEQACSIYFAFELKAKTWNCELCKKKRLDRQRNCGYRKEKNKKKDFAIQVGEQLYTSCPIYYIDTPLLSKAIESFNIYDNGFLPDSGGFYDQTIFFIRASMLVQQYIRIKEQKEMEKTLKEGD